MNAHPSIPPCVNQFIVAAVLEAERFLAICEELPPEHWPAWCQSVTTRLAFHPAAPGLMSTVPPAGGEAPPASPPSSPKSRLLSQMHAYKRRLSLAVLLVLVTACTPLERHTALVAVGAAGCGGGQAAEAAGEDWGRVVAAIGCWLADWAAERLDRIREAERLARVESTDRAELAAELAQLEEVEARAEKLRAAQAAVLAHPCEQHESDARQALEECEAARR